MALNAIPFSQCHSKSDGYSSFPTNNCDALQSKCNLKQSISSGVKSLKKSSFYSIQPLPTPVAIP